MPEPSGGVRTKSASGGAGVLAPDGEGEARSRSGVAPVYAPHPRE